MPGRRLISPVLDRAEYLAACIIAEAYGSTLLTSALDDLRNTTAEHAAECRAKLIVAARLDDADMLGAIATTIADIYRDGIPDDVVAGRRRAGHVIDAHRLPVRYEGTPFGTVILHIKAPLMQDTEWETVQ